MIINYININIKINVLIYIQIIFNQLILLPNNNLMKNNLQIYINFNKIIY